MDSDAEDTKSQMTPSSTPSQTHKHKKNKKKNKNRAPPETNNPDQLQATIKVVPSNPDMMPPLVGYFPSGFDPTKYPDPQVRVFKHKQRGGRLDLVVTPNVGSSGRKVDFVGTSYSGEAQVGEFCSYGLGVLDKATQILRIAPIAGNKIFRLEPKVQGLDFANPDIANPDKGEINAQERILQFQTKKAQQRNKKMQKLRQADDADSQIDLDALKPVETNTEGPEATADHNSRNTPPFDATATHPEMAYPLDKIIASVEWESLQDISKLLQGGSVLSRDAFPTFVCNRVHKLQRIKDEDQKNKLSCILTYITHLIKFKDLHSMDGFSSAKNHKMPPVIKHKFLSMFEPAAKKMSPEKSNLLISYVLVLTLFADEFQTSLPDIATDLRMPRPTLRTQYERLGCKITGKNDSAVVKLPVPLQFPKMKMKRKRSNR